METTDKRYKDIAIIGGFSIFILLFLLGSYIFVAIGFGIFIWAFANLFYKIGSTVDIRDLIIIIPIIQWFIGPFLSYRFSTDTIFYYMSIDEKIYTSFVVPGILLFAIGLYINTSHRKIQINDVIFKIQYIIKINKNIDILLITIGLIANVLIPYSPSFLMFFIFLTGNLQYVGLLLLQQNKQRKNKKLLFISVILIMSILALSRGMFQLLLLWFTFLFIITSFINKTSNLKKILIGLSIFVVAFFIQSVKHEFRQIIWNTEASDTENSQSNTEVFSELVSERLNRTELLTSEENINNIIARINQGWIISRIMKHMPVYEPFANGETFVNAITGTLLPRFLNPSKVKAGNAKNFVRFTGRKLVSGTAMGMSIIGEAYANFGKNGGIIFMFIFGLFLNLSHSFLISKLKAKPILLFFIPLIFLQVVKAESNFMIVFNHLIKSTIFVFLVLWGLKTFFNMKKL